MAPQHKPLSGPQVAARLFVLECIVTESLEIMLNALEPEKRDAFIRDLRAKAIERVKNGTQHLEAMTHGEMYIDKLIQEVMS